MPNREEKARTTKLEAIVARIRQGIRSRQFAPGAQLPSRQTIVETSDATWVTVQRAFDRLKAEGDIESIHGKGTYVADEPPCLHRYGIVFPHRPHDQGLNPYFRSFADAARQLAASSTARRFRLYQGAYHYRDGTPAGPAYRELIADLRALRLAGLLYVRPPWPLEGGGPLTYETTPQAAVGGGPDDHAQPRGRVVYENVFSLLEKALDAAAQQGRRRVGFIVPAHRLGPESWQALQAMLPPRGLTTAPYLLQSPELRHPEWVANTAELLLRLPHAQRPDALVLLDDNLVEPARRGIQAAGVTVPDELTVVAHCNYPLPEGVAQPFLRLGCDAREALEGWIQWCRRVHLGEAAGETIAIPVRRPEEVAPWPCRAPTIGAETADRKTGTVENLGHALHP